MAIRLCANCDHRAMSHKRRRSEGGYARFECHECVPGKSFCCEYVDPRLPKTRTVIYTTRKG